MMSMIIIVGLVALGVTVISAACIVVAHIITCKLSFETLGVAIMGCGMIVLGVLAFVSLAGLL